MLMQSSFELISLYSYITLCILLIYTFLFSRDDGSGSNIHYDFDEMDDYDEEDPDDDLDI